MLYQEFLEGTGCRNNEYNFMVYQDLEKMYTNSDISKSEIYKFAKKIVDNTEPPEIVELKKNINAEISELKELIEYTESQIDYYKYFLPITDDKEEIKRYKGMIKRYRQEIKQYKIRINNLKWVLG